MAGEGKLELAAADVVQRQTLLPEMFEVGWEWGCSNGSSVRMARPSEQRGAAVGAAWLGVTGRRCSGRMQATWSLGVAAAARLAAKPQGVRRGHGVRTPEAAAATVSGVRHAGVRRQQRRRGNSSSSMGCRAHWMQCERRPLSSKRRRAGGLHRTLQHRGQGASAQHFGAWYLKVVESG